MRDGSPCRKPLHNVQMEKAGLVRWWKEPHTCGRATPDQAPSIITLLCAKATERSASASTTRDQAIGGCRVRRQLIASRDSG